MVGQELATCLEASMTSLRVDTLHGNIISDKQVAIFDVQRLTSVYELTCRAPPSLLLICDRSTSGRGALTGGKLLTVCSMFSAMFSSFRKSSGIQTRCPRIWSSLACNSLTGM